MKKLLSLALAAVMMISTASIASAVDGLEVSEAEKANPKFWIDYSYYSEDDGGAYVYDVWYDVGTELKAITSTGGGNNIKYTGKAIQSLAIHFTIDEDVIDMDNSWNQGYGDFEDATVAYNATTKDLYFTHSFSTTAPKKFVAEEKGILGQLYLFPVDADSFDPESLKLPMPNVQIRIDEYEGAKAVAHKTGYGNFVSSDIDYPIISTMNVEVLTDDYDGKADGTQIVAYSKNVEEVTAATTVTVSYEGEEKTYGNFGALLGIEGDGTAEGTVRFAVLCADTLDPNGFLFTIN